MPNYTALIHPLEYEVWIAAAATYFFCWLFFLWYVKRKPCAEGCEQVTQNISVSDTVIWMIAFVIDESVPITQTGFKGRSIRVFLVMFLFASFTLTVSYRGILTSFLTVSIPPYPIDTIDELAYQVDTPVASFGPFFVDQTRASPDPRMQVIAERYMTHYDFDQAFNNASQGQVVIAESEITIKYNIRARFSDEYATKTNHLCLIGFGNYLLF